MLSTNYNKLVGAGVGGATGTIIAYVFPAIPFEVQEAMVVLLAMFGAWVFPKNKGA